MRFARHTFLHGWTLNVSSVADVKRWLQAFLLYLPGIALFVTGVVVLLVMPTVSASTSCTCTTGPNGTICPPCASPALSINPVGPLLILASPFYALVVYLIRRRAPPTPSTAIRVSNEP
jgi:hypothetical protein